MFNDTFYPTPKPLINKMLSKIKGQNIHRILEPSAGKGDIIDALTSEYDYKGNYNKYQRTSISAIEIDNELQATLRGKGIKVIDTDFLSFSGTDKFDVIIGNPPFDAGDKHLLKAIDILYRGEIIFLLNAETIKNPYTNNRKELTRRLSALNAEIEYLTLAFRNAERPTDVECALIYINVERNIEDDLFVGCDDTAEDMKPELENNYEVSTGKTVDELVAEYNQIIHIGTETIFGYYRNYKKIGRYIGLNMQADKDFSANVDMTTKMQGCLNELLVNVRTSFWRRTLDLKEVSSRLTQKRRAEFEHKIEECCHMDFTVSNIRQFILNLITGFEKTLTEAVMEIFDKFTIRHCFSDGLYDENIHMFNGWKTNKAFKVNKKVIIPIHAGYGGEGPFKTYRDKWKLDYDAARQLNDVDIVMNYFNGMPNYYSISDAMTDAFDRNQSSRIESTYFTITAYKKGTIHLTFNDEDILRRFNLAAAKGKGWLPHDYGAKKYEDCDSETRAAVDSFEGQLSYSKNLNKPVFAVTAHNSVLQIAA